MAENLYLYDLTKPGVNEINLVLNDRAVTAYEDSVEADIFWRWEDEPATFPQYLGTAAAGTAIEVPFTISGSRAIRLFLISRTAGGNQTETDPRRAREQYVYTPAAIPGPDSIVVHEGFVVTHEGNVVTHSV